jgi:hypothetical protein
MKLITQTIGMQSNDKATSYSALNRYARIWWKRKAFILSATSIIIVSLLSCKKEPVTGLQGPAGADGISATGTIAGYIKLLDETGKQSIKPVSTVTVKVKGTNLLAIADTNGYYSVGNVLQGIHTLEYSAQGYGTIQKQQVIFQGNGTLYVHSGMSALPAWTIHDATVTVSGERITASVSITTSQANRSFLLIVSETPNPAIADPASFENHGSKDFIFYTVTPVLTSTFSIKAFPTGTSLYVKIYPYAYNAYSYYDFDREREIPTAAGQAFPEIFSLVVP